jgi:hypothetical protein
MNPAFSKPKRPTDLERLHITREVVQSMYFSKVPGVADAAQLVIEVLTRQIGELSLKALQDKEEE